MCGMFVRHSSLSLLEKTFYIDSVETSTASSYNIAPAQKLLAVVRDSQNRLVDLHWGLVPYWAKDRSIGNRLINARAETVAEKPSFRNAFKKRRCLIVADGFYEWKGEKGNKQPWYLTLPDENPFAFAGLWELWSGDKDSKYYSCTIITTAASESVSAIHHRMPVILRPHIYHTWLDSAAKDADQLKQLMQENHFKDLRCFPVSKRVNAVANNDADCIEPLEETIQG